MDWFGTAVRDETELAGLYGPPHAIVARKQIDHLDAACVDYLALCRFVVLSSADALGRCDVTPRGGTAGFVEVLDERTLAIPDASGNRRIDTLRNVLQTGRLGLLAVLPGRASTLRINGRACVSRDPDLLERLGSAGNAPVAALVLAVEEVFVHCPKAFSLSGLWNADTWPAKDAQPSPGAMLRGHVGEDVLSLAAAESSMADPYATRPV